MQYLSAQLPAVATLPFTLTLCFGFLFYFLGISFLAGLAVFVLSLMMNVSLSRVLARFQKRYMKKQDARVSMTSETLNNIKTIKLYSWIEKFIKIIDDLRNEELSVQWWRMNILMITLGSLTFFPLALQTASFSTYIGTGNVISLPVAYTLMTIFNIINGPIRMLPMFLGQLIEFTVAMKRIQQFLLCQEINQSLIYHDDK